jgi:hypothetical protein
MSSLYVQFAGEKNLLLLIDAFSITIMHLISPEHHATKIAEIFHILGMFLIFQNLYVWYLPWDSHHLSFFPTFLAFHSIFQFQLVF